MSARRWCCWLTFACLAQVWICARASSFCTAYLNVQVNHSASALPGNLTTWRREVGLFGRESPRYGLKARVLLAEPVHACSPDTRFRGARRETGWIALMKRGSGCTFTEKINRAADRGAAVALIYNEDGTENSVIQMAHPGTTIVAVMMGNVGGTTLAELLHMGVPVTMEIEVGRVFEPLMSHYSIFLISVSFIIITTATVAYFIYYTARRLYRARLQNRKQNQLKAKAKKAMSQLQIRTLKHGDKECVGPDADSCAVCIDVYKPGDVLSVLTCSHFFHKVCVEPWLLEHRTCPMCKSDVLKALGVEVDEETPPDLSSSSSDESLTHSDSVSHTHISSVSHTLSDAASSGYESMCVSDTHTGLEVVCVETQPHYDNPAYERDPAFGRDPTL
ncbi:E3 ubiquitin-protein ligase RNF128a [Pygocentrus nattereri]|uniref:Ring finger protein 128a n=1 Tax=Pygocentrus nattereri TaxID=42514 RepID=A0A3B4DPU4_PYGNA|nr:E3 ubiquitin-protein ligase RNF128a [Pygocentrus nattereri]